MKAVLKLDRMIFIQALLVPCHCFSILVVSACARFLVLASRGNGRQTVLKAGSSVDLRDRSRRGAWCLQEIT
jgi:hypothetical protein